MCEESRPRRAELPSPGLLRALPLHGGSGSICLREQEKMDISCPVEDLES